MSRKPALSEFAAANESNGDLRLFFNEFLAHHTGLQIHLLKAIRAWTDRERKRPSRRKILRPRPPADLAATIAWNRSPLHPVWPRWASCTLVGTNLGPRHVANANGALNNVILLTMNPQQEWPIVLRLVWLTGGLVAVNEPSEREVRIKSSPIGRTFKGFRINSYPSIFSTVKSLGFSIIGTTFVRDEKQFEGLRAPEFRAAGTTGGWPTWRVWEKWRQITFAAGRQRELRLMDLASRLAAGLQYSEMRLYDLALSYSQQLHSYLDRNEVKPQQAFKDSNSPTVYKNVHALFWEMAVLRDVLAEFIAAFCLNRDHINKLSELLGSLKKSPSTDSLVSEVVRASDHNSAEGWLARFGSYRNCFTHSAPLELVSGFAFAIQDLLILKDGTSIPQIYYALPQDPEGVRRARARGVPFESLDDLIAATARSRDRAKEPDALEYLHGCLCRLTEVAARLIPRSPIAPQPIIFTKKDIIGEIEISHGG